MQGKAEQSNFLHSVSERRADVASDPTRRSRHDFPSSRPGRTLLFFLVVDLHPGHVRDLTSVVTLTHEWIRTTKVKFFKIYLPERMSDLARSYVLQNKCVLREGS